MSKRFNIGVTLILMTFTALWGQVRQERDYIRSYALAEEVKVEVVSKYGEVIVRTWEKDSVRIKVVVKAEGKNSAVVRKSMERVDIRFRKIGSIVSAVTEVSKSNGVLGNLMNEVEGVVGRNNKLQVDYEVWMPAGVDLSVENKFGDVYLADLGGRVDLTVSHGDIKANRLDQTLTLKQSFGKSSFGKVDEVTMTLRGVDIRLEEARRLRVESGSSEIRVDQVDQAEFNSRNDKIRLKSAKEVICKGSFTDLSSDYIEGSARLDFSYGDIYLSRINKDFKSIDITGKSTDIHLIMNQAAYIKARIKGSEDRMILPNSMLLMQREQLENDGLIVLTGEVGNANTRSSRLDIDTEGGELIIAIKDTPIFTDRK